MARYVPVLIQLPEYTQLQEDDLALLLAGSPSSLLPVIFNTDLNKERSWNGTIFINAPLVSPTIIPLVNVLDNGFAPATGAPTGKFLKDDLTWAAPAGSGAADIKETEIDFGNGNYITDQTFSITDIDVSAGSQVIAYLSIKSPSDGRDVDEVMWEELLFCCKANSGNFDMFVRSLCGSVNGKFVVNYLVG